MRLFKPFAALMILCLVFALAACGGASDPGESNAAAPTATPSDSPAATDSPKPADGTRTFKHAMGEAPITGIPKRVVVLEWTYGEDLLALGVQPVGFADIQAYKQYVNIEPQLDASVVDVGTRQEPNLESIMALKPDLIIAVKFRVEATYDALNKIAPTLVFNPYPSEGEGDQYEEMVQTFKTIADVLGKTAEADAVLGDLDRTYEEAKAKIVASGKDKTPFALAMAFSNQNAVTFRISTDNSLAVKTLEHIGLTNAFKSKQFEVYGFSATDVEALPAVQNANFLHMIQESDNVIENQLKNNPVWNGLQFVKENRVYALGGDMWPYGGPLSAQIMARKTADLLTK